MSERKYKVGDYVVLNTKFQAEYNTDNRYAKGTVLQIIQTDNSVDLHYEAEIPNFLGDFHSVFIGDSYIDHEATAELNKE